ncbi:SRPBCC family protein [Lonsdalea quercina]|uniref:SRPBCC family protein n=1 Tax=Lonsdalea quercina TaxID=71657 RepID=UPI003974BA54
MSSTFLNNMGVKGPNATRFGKSIVIDLPADMLFDLWRKPETLPVLMNHFARIDILNATDSLWRVKAPLGPSIEWTARIVEEQPGSFIHWCSLAGARVPNEGKLVFQPAPQGKGTEVTLTIYFDAPGGFLGRQIGQMFALLSKEMLNNTLQRFKKLAEQKPAPSAASS